MKAGSVVIANCVDPKEQLWGNLLELSPTGLALRGLDIRSFEDWMRQMSRPEEERSLGLVTMFVPMHRIERIFVDERVGQVPSYCDQFLAVVGRDVAGFLAEPGARARPARRTPAHRRPRKASPRKKRT